MFSSLTTTELTDLAGVLCSYTSKCKGTALSIALDNGTILPPIPFTNFPQLSLVHVKLLKQLNLLTYLHTYGGDTRSRNLYKKLVQVDLYKKLDRLTWFLVFFLYKFLAPNTAQLYSIQETCMHVTRMVSSDWSAAYHCHCFHFVVLMLLTICCTKLI